MATDEEDRSYERGKIEGEIKERLASHDRHFQAINGQLGQVAASLTDMTTAITRVGDKQQAIIDTNEAITKAVRAASAKRWSVWQRVFAVVGALAAAIGAYATWRALH
jgi:t-SNARE complex subunit (syntaxin)